jgi:uncharacterized protein GlcG (DUF336 family)
MKIRINCLLSSKTIDKSIDNQGNTMKKLVSASLGALAVTLFAFTICSAIAQVPPDPNNPAEAMPDTMTLPLYGDPINIETAKKAAAGAVAEAVKRNWNGLCVAIVNPSGDLVYFEKQDNCMYVSTTLSQHKARSSARWRRPTLVFERLVAKGPYYAFLPSLDDVVPVRGGNPLVVGGKVIGAIGVSGGSGTQDDVVSQAGVAALAGAAALK